MISFFLQYFIFRKVNALSSFRAMTDTRPVCFLTALSSLCRVTAFLCYFIIVLPYQRNARDSSKQNKRQAPSARGAMKRIFFPYDSENRHEKQFLLILPATDSFFGKIMKSNHEKTYFSKILILDFFKFSKRIPSKEENFPILIFAFSQKTLFPTAKPKIFLREKIKTEYEKQPDKQQKKQRNRRNRENKKSPKRRRENKERPLRVFLLLIFPCFLRQRRQDYKKGKGTPMVTKSK